MGATTNPLFKDHYSISIISITKRLLPWTLFALFSIAFVYLYFYPLLQFTTTPSPKIDDLSHSSSIPNISLSYYPSLHASPPSPSPSSSEKEKVYEEKSCDYSNGKWVRDKRGPLYNDTNCGMIKEGVEKSSTRPNNLLYLDRVDEKWARHMDQMDLIVLSIGQWFLLPAIYYESGSILGCHYCPGLNHTEIGFYNALRKALRTTLNSIIERKSRSKGKNGIIDVVVATFSPHHFEGDWDKAGACPKTMPYGNREKKLEGMDAEMRKIEIEEMEIANDKAKSVFSEFGRLIRLEALDVTELSLLRPDGHPGPYMNPFPFANGVQEHVQNDCVHWCLPGPIDTWNEILMQIMKKWDK
ncbi:hypothetical protein PIB30_059232 [Stylosanthes scabra]|uniref:Trichome birefringence-like C-terminal domain-containing protein n=1 Tax=Stylosanthes scabra TaxID=79078 RepID=A0ABU6SL13_9FABA|nr:hypothetical protein [Stylosanthes scabra]